MIGADVVPLRFGATGLGVAFDWWPDAYTLGPVYNDESVRMNYFAYGVEATRRLTGPHQANVEATAGVGGETIRFGERHEASVLLPKSSTGPAAFAGVGVRLPLNADGRLVIRLDVRGRATAARIFDPTGVRSGREGSYAIGLVLGLSYLLDQGLRLRTSVASR